MEAIRPLWEQMPLTPLRAEDRTQSAFVPFTDMFETAIAAVKETDAEKSHYEYLMATGQLDNPALLTTAAAKAEMSVDLLLQLRNKALEAYNELMRISL